jgi:hypothetical protein
MERIDPGHTRALPVDLPRGGESSGGGGQSARGALVREIFHYRRSRTASMREDITTALQLFLARRRRGGIVMIHYLTTIRRPSAGVDSGAVTIAGTVTRGLLDHLVVHATAAIMEVTTARAVALRLRYAPGGFNVPSRHLP